MSGPTSAALRASIDWLTFCKENGWSSTQLPALADLWWQWHDDDGRLLDQPRATDTSTAVQSCDCSRWELCTDQPGCKRAASGASEVNP